MTEGDPNCKTKKCGVSTVEKYTQNQIKVMLNDVGDQPGRLCHDR